MAEQRSNWKTVLQQIVTFNLSDSSPDPFWLMICRRLTKRKMESSDKERGGEEGEPGPSASSHEGPALLGDPSPTRLNQTGDNCNQIHRYAVLIGDRGDSLDKMNKFHFECPLADSWVNKYEESNLTSSLASGDDNMDQIMSKLQKSAGYQFLHLLTEGRFSKVFLAKATGCEKKVVFKLTSKRRKVLNREDTTAPTSVATNTAKRTRLRFGFAPLSEEGQIHNNLKHKNIVQMHGYLVENDRLGLVMEWCHLGSLDNLLKKTYSGLLAEAVARRYFNQMVEAVEYIHQVGYIHRDVTCHHFLIDYNDVIKLCDFGLTEINQDRDINNALEIGSLGYQPPEYLQGLPCDGKQFDVWGLSCCLFKITTARLPFGTDGRKLMMTLSENKPVRLEFPNLAVRLSADLRELLTGLLAILPGARFSMNRLKNSAWLKRKDSRVFIGNSHLLKQPVRTSTSIAEEIWKSSLDI